MRVDSNIAVLFFVALVTASALVLSGPHMAPPGMQPYVVQELATYAQPQLQYAKFQEEGTMGATGMLARAIPSKVQQTVIITGIDLNDMIGQDVEVLTGSHLSSLRGGIIQTQAGTTRYSQLLRLKRPLTPAFDGGMLVYSKSEDDSVGDFMFFESNTPLFEYQLEFNPGLEGELRSGKSDDIEDESLLLLGKGAFISRVEASGTKILIRFVTSAGEIEFEDKDVTDNDYESGVEVNGESIEATVRIKGSVSGNRVRIFSIEYRPEARSLQGDIYVPPRHGVRGFLLDKASLLSSSFDIIYGGLSGGLPRATTTGIRPSVSGDKVIFRPAGDDEYKLFFTNVRGQQYDMPLYALDGSISLGDGDRDLVVAEGSSSADFNIDESDYFLVSSGTSTSSTTNVLKLSKVDSDRIFVDDLAGPSHEEVFDTTTGEGTLTVSGRSYRFFADTATNRIVVDQTGDGSFSSDRARIILPGGPQIQIFSSSLVFRVPEKLFKDDSPGSDETTTINVFENDGDIDLSVSESGDFELNKASDRIERGMTQFGVLFELDDDRSPSKLELTVPRGQRAAIVQTTPLSGGQNRGWIVVTTERERFLRD